MLDVSSFCRAWRVGAPAASSMVEPEKKPRSDACRAPRGQPNDDSHPALLLLPPELLPTLPTAVLGLFRQDLFRQDFDAKGVGFPWLGEEAAGRATEPIHE